MPVVQVYRHGMTVSASSGGGSMIRGKRGTAKGWTAAVTRRNLAFLRSVDERNFIGVGFAFTLTVRDCPSSAREWARIRDVWIKCMRKAGMLCLYWLTEWQLRGVPHLHGCIWFDTRIHAGLKIIGQWERLTEYLGSGPFGQYVRPIDGELGWFKYLAKHASRGVKNYQRSSANIPAGWRGNTGRMWGHCGDWPIRKPIQLVIHELEGFHVFRRLVRRWRIADARKNREWFRVRRARAMLKCGLDEVKPQAWETFESYIARKERKRKYHPYTVSKVRGLSEWIPLNTQEKVAIWLDKEGYTLYRKPDDLPELKRR